MLVVVRNHREKLGDVGVEEGAEVGRWLGVISRAVVGSVREDELGRDVGEEGKGEGDVGDWNVVQNNGMFGLAYIFIWDATNGLETVHAARASVCHTWDETEPWRRSCSWSLGLTCDPSPITVMQLNPYNAYLFLFVIGARAAQVVPHVHFHIIPRVGDVPEVKARSWTVFGKGQREDLDEEDAVVLVKRMRERLGREIERTRRREGDEGVRALLGEGTTKKSKL